MDNCIVCGEGQVFTAPEPDECAIQTTIELVVDGPTELRSPLCQISPSYHATVSGYYDDPELLSEDAYCVSNEGESNVYFTLNRISEDLLARSYNRHRIVRKGMPTTSDAEIIRRRWILVNADPARPSGISSNNVEHERALQRAREVRDYLSREGWNDPIFADSGNGAHLLYSVDMPSEDGGLVKRLLKKLAARFDDDFVKIDTTVHNPARVCKLYGTVTRKGDHLPERPHRVSRILEV